MGHTELSMKRPVTTVMVFLALAVIGGISTRLLPLEMWPDIEFPGLFVQIPYQASTPQEVERRITRPVEEALATLPGIQFMRSTSSQDSAQIGIFMGWDRDIAPVGVEARTKIDAIRHELPEDVRNIFVFSGSTSDQPVIVLRVSGERDLGNAYETLTRHVVRRLNRIEGVSQVRLEGVEPQEIKIHLDPDRMAAHNLDIGQLRTVLQAANFSVSAGRITDSGTRFAVRPIGELHSLADVEDIIISGNVRVRDIAQVTQEPPERNYGRHLDRQYAVGISIFKSPGSNMVEVVDRVMEELDEIGQIPQMRGINLFVLDNPAEGVRTSINDLLTSGLIGALLAIIVLYLFLRQITTTLIVTLAVPFSLLITLGALYFFGLSLNILTMMGLMLAVGMLVDNGVVVTESIFSVRQRDPAPERAEENTLKGVREVGLSVVAGTMTSVAVFAPIIFSAKDVDLAVFLQHVAITIVVALLASLLIAQTLIPMLATRVRLPEAAPQGSAMNRFINAYARFIAWSMHLRGWRRLYMVGIVVGMLVVPAASIGLVKFDMFPNDPDRTLFLPYWIEGEFPVERMEEVVTQVEDYLYENQERFEFEAVYSYFDQERAQSTILLRPDADRTKSAKLIMEEIEENMPEIIIGDPSFDREEQGGTEGFSVQISGDSTDVLAELSEEVSRLIETVPGLTNARSDSATGDREVRVVVDRDRAQSYGLSTAVIAQAVATAMRGENLREVRTGSGELAVRLAYRDNEQQTVDQLGQLPLYTPSGDRVTLETVADLTIATGMRSIVRTDRQTSVSINADLVDVEMDTVRPQIEALLNEYELPPGYSWGFGRGFQRSDDSQQMMVTNILLGVVMIFIVMAALFESLLYPLSIITSIVYSVLGVFLFFAVTGTTFSFMATIGIMILIGVVVNNGIVLVDHINNLRRKGLARDDAIIEGCRDRLRPILMTVATTILGLMPLAMGDTKVGGGGPSYYPMARAIIGGLAYSTLASLLVVPSFYAWLDSLKRWTGKVGRVASGQLAAG